jgi:uncharacterized iron-regulated protein
MMRRLALFVLAGCAPTAPAAFPVPIAITRAGAPSDLTAMLDAAAEADAVCLGEHHDEPDHHHFQHAVLRHLIATRAGSPLALGLEMVQRPYQPVLDDYAAGTIDEAELERALDWKRRWGFDFAMYRPLFVDAHDYGVPLIALNAPRELTRAVARRGIDNLDATARAWLPELDLGDEAHRRFFTAALPAGHDADRLYAAQVVWDETMAETAAAVMAQGARMLVVAGNAHCQARAIPARIERRRSGKALSVLLVASERDLPAHATSDFVVTLPARSP